LEVPTFQRLPQVEEEPPRFQEEEPEPELEAPTLIQSAPEVQSTPIILSAPSRRVETPIILGAPHVVARPKVHSLGGDRSAISTLQPHGEEEVRYMEAPPLHYAKGPSGPQKGGAPACKKGKNGKPFCEFDDDV
jgi:hypothetical protein